MEEKYYIHTVEPFGDLLVSPLVESPILLSLLLLSEDELSKARIPRDNRRSFVKLRGKLTEEIETFENVIENAISDCLCSTDGFSVREDMADFRSLAQSLNPENPNPPSTTTSRK